jgi:hypothetical protein
MYFIEHLMCMTLETQKINFWLVSKAPDWHLAMVKNQHRAEKTKQRVMTLLWQKLDEENHAAVKTELETVETSRKWRTVKKIGCRGGNPDWNS